jgi:hypothetical protein
LRKNSKSVILLQVINISYPAKKREFMKSFAICSFTIIAVVILSACSGKQRGFQNSENRADTDVRKSFSLSDTSADAKSASTGANNAAGLKLDQTQVSIQRSALEKEFLIQVNLVMEEGAPAFHSQKSRVVFFREVEKKLYLIEASKGLLIAKDYPQTLVLTEFPILAETEQSISFDFNAGMDRLFVGGDWHARDLSGSSPSVAYQAVKTKISYIEKAGFSNSNRLEIRQMAQIELSLSDGSLTNLPVEAVYYLQPYAPSPNFMPTRAPRNLEHMGFFEASPQFNEESGTISYAAKLDINKPIIYAISANTPAEYKSAIRDGILYWNRALGKDLIQVIDAPSGLIAPSPDTILSNGLITTVLALPMPMRKWIRAPVKFCINRFI